MKKIIFILIFVFLCVSGFCGNLKMSVLDVGQGLCCVITSPDNHTMIFDCGTLSSKDYKYNLGVFDRVLLPYLNKNKIKKIDYLFLSHPNFDHYSGFIGLVKKYSVGKYIKNGFSSSAPNYNDLQKELKKKKISANVARADQVYYLGTWVKIYIIAPLDNTETENDNDQSLMVKVVYKDTSFILSGDASEWEEKRSVRKYHSSLRANVLLVAHHGSHTSSSIEFLNAVKPNISVISCGLNNKYGHPHRETIERLKRVKTNIFRTDLVGNVILVSDGKKVTVTTQGRKDNRKKFML